MTIRFRVNSGIDMKRILLLLLTLLLLLPLVACNGEEKHDNVFVLQNGGYQDTQTGVWYRPLPLCYEPVKSAATRGVALFENGDVQYSFLEMPDLDSRLWLCDDLRGVWYAGEWTITPAALTPRALVVNEESAISLERARLAVGKDDALIGEILETWFLGEAVEEPIGEITVTRRLRLISEELPGIYYCFDFYMCNGQGYFYGRTEARYVAVSATVAAQLAAY